MRLRLPRFGSRSGSSGDRRGGAGLLAGLGLGGLIGGSMFGGGGGPSGGSGFSTRSSLTPSSALAGKANFRPLPAFSSSTSKVAKKYNNPTLSNVSEQLSAILGSVSIIEKTLKDQFEFQKYQYRENARIQKEINAESIANISSSGSLLGGVGFGSILAALKDVITTIDQAAVDIAREDSSGFNLPMVIPSALAGAAVAKGIAHDYSFKPKAEALDADGRLKAGYEEVKDKKGRTKGYRLAKPVDISALEPDAAKPKAVAKPGIVDKAKGALGTAGNFVKKVATKAVAPAVVAYTAWEAWQEIQALPSDMDPSEKKREITKIVSRLVKDVGLAWAGLTLGALVGSAVPVFGTVTGAVVGVTGAIAADQLLGDSTDEIVNKIIDRVMPIKKDSISKSVEPTSSTPVSNTPELAKKPSITSNRESANDILHKAANRVGVEPSSLFTIAKIENPSIDFNNPALNKIFNLTLDQWSHVKSKYGSSVVELNNGINDLRANALAAALLARESRDFLRQNSIPEDQETIYSGYLLGESGLNKMIKSDPGSLAKDIVPQAASKNPEKFQDASAVPFTVSDFMSNSFRVDLSTSSSLSLPSSTPEVPKADAEPTYNSSNPEVAEPVSFSGSDIGSSTPPESPQATPVSTSGDATPIQNPGMSTPMVDATPMPVPTSEIPDMIQSTSMEVDSLERDFDLTFIQQDQNQDSNTILPSSNPGYTGTGNVPDPTFDLGELGRELFFTSAL